MTKPYSVALQEARDLPMRERIAGRHRRGSLRVRLERHARAADEA
jgi:hypothetical protein